MSIRSRLLFIFLVAFSSITHADMEDAEAGILENLFKDLQVGINYGNLSFGNFNEAKLLLFEFRSIVNHDRKNPQGIAIGIGTQKQGNQAKGYYRGKHQVLYVMYDYGYRIRLSRRLKTYAILGLGYAYSRKSDYYRVGVNGFATSRPRSDNTQAFVGYVGMRYSTKIAKHKAHFDLRYYRGEVVGSSLGIAIML